MPQPYNAMVIARAVKRSFVSALLLALICAPAFSFSLWRHHSPKPQIVVDGRPLLFTVEPTIDKDDILRAPADFVRTLGGDFTVNSAKTTLTIHTADGREVSEPCVARDDRYIVDAVQAARDAGADANWDSRNGVLTLRARVMLIKETGGSLQVVTSYPIHYSTGALDNPSRIYVDLVGAVLPQSPTTVPVMADGVKQIRAKQLDFNTVRVALDLTHTPRVAEASTDKLSTIQVALGGPSTSPEPVMPPAVPGAVPPSGTVVASAPDRSETQTPETAIPKAPDADAGPTRRRTGPIAPGLDVNPSIGTGVPGATSTDQNPPTQSSPGAVRITGITTQTDTTGKVEVVVTTSGPLTAPFVTHSLDNPDRFALDLPAAVLDLPSTLTGSTLNVGDSVIKAVRWGSVQMGGADFGRIVLDLALPATFTVTSSPNADGSGMTYTIEPGTPGPAPLPLPGGPGDIAPPQSKGPIDHDLTGKQFGDLTIVVDPGHGGKDTGAPGVDGIYEKNLTLEIGKDLRDALVAENVKVIMTREDDTFIPLPVRSQDGIDNNADIFVSIHCDSGSYRNAQEGSTVYYHSNNQVCRDLALHIAAKLKEANMGIKSDGVKTDYIRFPGVGFSVLRRSPEPAVLVECGYVNNDADAKQLTDPDVQTVIANCIVAGLKDFVAEQQMANKN